MLPNSPPVSLTVSDWSALNPRLTQAVTQAWQVGTVLQVSVNRQSAEHVWLKTPDGTLKLPIAKPLPFASGEALKLTVEQLQPALKLRLAPLLAATITSKPLATTITPTSVASAATTLSSTSAAPSSLAYAAGKLADTLLPQALAQRPAVTEAVQRSLASKPAIARSTLPLNLPTNWPRLLLTELPVPIRPAALALSALTPSLLTPPPSRPQLLNQLQQLLPLLPQPRPTSPPAPVDTHHELANHPINRLLAQMPKPEQLTDNDRAMRWLRHHLLASVERPASLSTNTPTASAQPRPGSYAELLTTVIRLLLNAPTTTSPGSSLTPEAQLPAQTLASSAAARPAPQTAETDPARPELTRGLPAPELVRELADDLAQLLGRQQLSWAHNTRADVATSGLYAELPVQQGKSLDLIELVVREEPGEQTDEQGTAHHVVRLRFDFPELGAMQFLLDLRGEELSLQFYSERESTEQLFNEHLTVLEQSLTSESIRLNQIGTHRVGHIPSLAPVLAEGFHLHV